jgi:hypothetical protein
LKNPKIFLFWLMNESLVRPFDIQALGEATSHPERIYLPKSSKYEIFVCLDLDLQTQIYPDPGTQLWKNMQVLCLRLLRDLTSS